MQPLERQARIMAREELPIDSQTLLIVAFESQTLRAAKAATAEIPVVFLHVTDPVADGLVKSLAHPNSNLTGIGEFFSDLPPRRVEIFSLVVPRPKTLLALTTHNDPLWACRSCPPRRSPSFLRLSSKAATEATVAGGVPRREWAERGALFSHGADFRSVGEDATQYVDRIS